MTAVTPTIPATYDGLDVEYRRLRTDRGLIDLCASGKFEVSGPAAVDFLDELCTRPVGFLIEERTMPALLLDEDGGIVADVILGCFDDHYLIEVWPAQRRAAWEHIAAQAHGRDGVSVRDRSEDLALYGVEGPQAHQTVQPFMEFTLAQLAYRSFCTTTWEGQPITIARTGVTAEYGYKILIAAEHGEALRQRLIELGALPCGLDALNVCRMESRFANIEEESPGATTSPFDLALQWMVDFGKDFIGKEHLLAQWNAGGLRRPVCFTAEPGTALAAGDELGCGGTTVGRISHALYSPGLDRMVGLAHVDEEYAASGLEFLTQGDGSCTVVSTCSAPFLVPMSIGVRQR